MKDVCKKSEKKQSFSCAQKFLGYTVAMTEDNTTTTREITFEEMFGSEADFQDWQDWRAACADAGEGVPTFDESR